MGSATGISKTSAARFSSRASRLFSPSGSGTGCVSVRAVQGREKRLRFRGVRRARAEGRPTRRRFDASRTRPGGHPGLIRVLPVGVVRSSPPDRRCPPTARQHLVEPYASLRVASTPALRGVRVDRGSQAPEAPRLSPLLLLHGAFLFEHRLSSSPARSMSSASSKPIDRARTSVHRHMHYIRRRRALRSVVDDTGSPCDGRRQTSLRLRSTGRARRPSRPAPRPSRQGITFNTHRHDVHRGGTRSRRDTHRV